MGWIEATATEEGQASVEWVAVVALIAVVLGATGTALAQAGFLGRGVTRQLARAVCVVSAGDCWRDREPCVVASDSKARGVSVQLYLVKLGGGSVALVEQRSDGTYAVTRGSSKMLTIEATAGPQYGFALAGLDVSAAAALTAAYGGTSEGGRTWILPSRAAVDQLLDGLSDRPVTGGGGRGATPQVIHGSAPPPDITYNKLATEASINASVGAHTGKDGISLGTADLRFDRDAGTRVDHRTGHSTIYSQATSRILLDGAGVLGLRSETGGELYAVELDAAGRPLDLRVTATGRYGGTADLPAALQPVAGMLGPGAAGRAFAVDAHLDLTDPANLAAARDLLDAMRPHFGSPAAATRALRERLAAHGTIEARVVDRTEDAGTNSLALPAGPKASLRWDHANVATRLRAAVSRGLDGQWIPRTECVA